MGRNYAEDALCKMDWRWSGSEVEVTRPGGLCGWFMFFAAERDWNWEWLSVACVEEAMVVGSHDRRSIYE